MYEQFDDKAIKSVLLAQKEARGLGRTFVEPEDLLVGLIAAKEGLASQTLESFGVNKENVRKSRKNSSSRGAETSSTTVLEMPLSQGAGSCLETAWACAKKYRQSFIGTQHILIGLIEQAPETVLEIFARLEVNLQSLRKAADLRIAKTTFVNRVFLDTFLNEISSSLKTSSSEREAFQFVTPVAGKVLHCSRFLAITESDSDTNPEFFEYWDDNVVKSCSDLTWSTKNSAVIDKILEARESVTIVEGQSQTATIQVEQNLVGSKSLMGIPLYQREEISGCLIAHQCDYLRHWDNEEIEWMEQLAKIIGDYLATSRNLSHNSS